MCARRFLMLIFILTLIFVAGAFALYQWGANVLLQQATPRGHFVAPPPRTGPQYDDLASWIARPEITGNPSQWAPQDYLGAAPPPRRAAAFYIHPTTYLEREQWNGPIGDQQSRDRADLFVRSQASAFADVADIWAPRYRQAAYGAFLLKTEDAKRALDLAYSDVDAAFDEFLRRLPPDRPIILAGHSQGALHLSRLLAERKAELKGRLVAAYVVGWPLDVNADLPTIGLPPCAEPEQIGCLLTWQSFSEPANPDMVLDAWEGTAGPGGAKRKREDMLCVNPVSGTVDGSAEALDNPGTLVPTIDLKGASLAVGQVGARCEKGLLILQGSIPNLGPFVLPGNNYHVYDYALFWGAIARDAMRRSLAWQ